MDGESGRMEHSDSARNERLQRFWNGIKESQSFWRPLQPGGQAAQPTPSVTDTQQQLLKEQMAETAIVQSFCRERENLLAELSRVRTIEAISALHARYVNLVSNAEQQLPHLFHLRTTMMAALDRAVQFYAQGQELALERARAYQYQSAREHAAREEARRQQAESRKLQAETDAYIRDLREQTRLRAQAASDRHHANFCAVMFGRASCPRCNGPKPVAHTYCYNCYH